VKIGLYGGTFDPIHLGHLRAAENAREQLALDLVAFVPAAVPPHRGSPLSAAADRLAMTNLATAPNPAFETWDTELKREGPSYTVETVDTLTKARPGDDFVLVVGADTWPEIPSWREPERLLGMVEVAVVERPGFAKPELTPPFGGARGARSVGGPGLPLSASAIREHARAGRSVRFLVPDAVADFIAERGLYRRC
jgi:nicotinate-nucleotide adenylyltransferase